MQIHNTARVSSCQEFCGSYAARIKQEDSIMPEELSIVNISGVDCYEKDGVAWLNLEAAALMNPIGARVTA